MQDGSLLAIRRFPHDVHARKQVGISGIVLCPAAFLRPERFQHCLCRVARQPLNELIRLEAVECRLLPKVHFVVLRIERRNAVMILVGHVDGIQIIALQVVDLHKLQRIKQQIQAISRDDGRIDAAPILSVLLKDVRNAVLRRMPPLFQRLKPSHPEHPRHKRDDDCPHDYTRQVRFFAFWHLRCSPSTQFAPCTQMVLLSYRPASCPIAYQSE